MQKSHNAKLVFHIKAYRHSVLITRGLPNALTKSLLDSKQHELVSCSGVVEISTKPTPGHSGIDSSTPECFG